MNKIIYVLYFTVTCYYLCYWLRHAHSVLVNNSRYFGPQSADSSNDEPPESESERDGEASDCWADVIYGSMERWHRWGPICSSVCVCVCVSDYTRDWVCMHMWNWVHVCVPSVYLCVYVSTCSLTGAASYIRPFQLQQDECSDLQPSAVKHLTLWSAVNWPLTSPAYLFTADRNMYLHTWEAFLPQCNWLLVLSTFVTTRKKKPLVKAEVLTQLLS